MVIVFGQQQPNMKLKKKIYNLMRIYPQLEDELLEWFCELRKQLKTVTRYMISAKARSIATKQEYRRIGIEEEEESNKLSPESTEDAEDNESDQEYEYCEHYKDKGNYVN
ncbi:19300_t:CDS:2, partial [Dentiscutata erythropus]